MEFIMTKTANDIVNNIRANKLLMADNDMRRIELKLREQMRAQLAR